MLSFWLAPRKCKQYCLDSFWSVVLTVSIKDQINHIVSGPSHLIETLGNQNTMILNIPEVGLCHSANFDARRTKAPPSSLQIGIADWDTLMIT